MTPRVGEGAYLLEQRRRGAEGSLGDARRRVLEGLAGHWRVPRERPPLASTGRTAREQDGERLGAWREYHHVDRQRDLSGRRLDQGWKALAHRTRISNEMSLMSIAHYRQPIGLGSNSSREF